LLVGSKKNVQDRAVQRQMQSGSIQSERYRRINISTVLNVADEQEGVGYEFIGFGQ
jgi:hypothetical protein